ncbi:hypothetical protein EVB91_082 [Rhizobium phage RHph_I1_18]|nr:hypothetical protein EVB91_082 [Rhizobium phage RHph_I1_18]
MKLFSQVNDCCKRKFIGVILTPIASAQLRAWCRFNGFNIEKSFKGKDIKSHEFDFHVTIIYTETYHDTQSGSWKIDPFDLVPIGFEMLGENKDIPAILIDPNTPGLIALRDQYKALGMKDKWPDFKPHISLSYAGGSTDGLKLPDFKLAVNRLTIENKE